MLDDSILEEVRQARDEYAKQFNYDIHAMAADLRKREQMHPEKLVSCPPIPDGLSQNAKPKKLSVC